MHGERLPATLREIPNPLCKTPLRSFCNSCDSWLPGLARLLRAQREASSFNNCERGCGLLAKYPLVFCAPTPSVGIATERDLIKQDGRDLSHKRTKHSS